MAANRPARGAGRPWHHDVVVDRRSLTIKDMAGALAILSIGLVVILGAMGLLSFGTTKDDGRAPTADVIGGIQRAAAALKLPLAVPNGLPAEWRGNSFTQTEPVASGGTRTVVRGGWLTSTGKFITLIQSAESPSQLVDNEVEPGLKSSDAVPVGGASWQVYVGQRREPVWVTTRQNVTLLITGSAPPEDFRSLAAAVG